MTGSYSGIAELEFSELGLSNDALLSTAMRHEATLYRVNVEPLEKLKGVDEQYLYWFKHLFLLTFFYDYCLDRSSEEQFPEAFFISANMWCEYRTFINNRYGAEGLKYLNRNNSQQVYYQMVEKQWLHPSEYQRNHPNYNEYYRKQILCLTHLQLLKLEDSTLDTARIVIEFYKRYWSLVLLIDDIMDVERDIESKTATPMIVWYFARNGAMPTLADAPKLRKFGKMEIDRLLPPFEKALFDLGIFDYLDMICDMRGKL